MQDWIKISADTPVKPEIWAIADILNIDPDAVLGKLLRMWIWFDQHTTSGNAPSVTKLLLDREVGVTGFCEAVTKAGWMVDANGKIVLPNFDRHNGKTAKTRAVTNRRVVKHRKKNVTPPPLQNALPEEEEEEDIKERGTNVPPKKKPKVFIPPDVSEVATYCAARGNKIDAETFCAHYDSCGWVVGQGNKKMKNWKAAVITWEKNHNDNGSGQRPQAARGTAAERNQQISSHIDRELKKELDGA